MGVIVFFIMLISRTDGLFASIIVPFERLLLFCVQGGLLLHLLIYLCIESPSEGPVVKDAEHSRASLIASGFQHLVK